MQELGLPVGAHIPMLGFIGRLDYQKGVDLIRDNHGWMMGEGVQLVLLGSGRADLEQSLRSETHPIAKEYLHMGKQDHNGRSGVYVSHA